MLYPISFIFDWITIEHQVQDMEASQKVQVSLAFANQKHVSGTSRASKVQCINRFN